MSYLLDTHSFLWAVFSPEELSRRARATIADTSTAVSLSSITLWEISLKFALGQLALENTVPGDGTGADQSVRRGVGEFP